ncbi:MAG: UMP kinase [Parachlamydiaceae bacterium]|nr:UMP kinase [Parachlamydiaceae bacterium]
MLHQKNTLPYRRILLKLSGEMLVNGQLQAIDPHACHNLAVSIKALHSTGVDIGLVIGGGNLFRGMNFQTMGMRRTPADQIGMLATLINGIALQQALENCQCPAKVLSAIECPKIAETYTWQRAHELLNTGHVVIFVGGTGNPYFTTDTAAALRASEISADVLIKATKVDGIYNKDPIKYPNATKYTTLNYSQMLAEKLEIMDATSIALCRSNHIPILVFNMELLRQGRAQEILNNPQMGTLVSGD